MFYDEPMMRHIEMHLIENAEDQRLANEMGLETSDSEVCETCFLPVGEDESGVRFVRFLIVLDDEAEWIVCQRCAEPVL
jgi:hypothetical protein